MFIYSICNCVLGLFYCWVEYVFGGCEYVFIGVYDDVDLVLIDLWVINGVVLVGDLVVVVVIVEVYLNVSVLCMVKFYCDCV